MWSSLVKIQYTQLKLCGNNPVVKNSIYSNGDLDLWPNDPKINRVLPLPQGNHVTKYGKDLIYRTKVIVQKPVWTPARPPPPAILYNIIWPVSRQAYKNDKRIRHKFFNLVLSSPYTYNIQYTIWYALLLHNFSKNFNMKTWNNKCSNKAECDNGIPLKVTNKTDPSIKKTGT